MSDFLDHVAQKEYALYELIIKEYNKQKEDIIRRIREGFETFSVSVKEGSMEEKPKVIKLWVAEEKIVEAKENFCLINLAVTIHYSVLVYYKEIEGL